MLSNNGVNGIFADESKGSFLTRRLPFPLILQTTEGHFTRLHNDEIFGRPSFGRPSLHFDVEGGGLGIRKCSRRLLHLISDNPSCLK